MEHVDAASMARACIGQSRTEDSHADFTPVTVLAAGRRSVHAKSHLMREAIRGHHQRSSAPYTREESPRDSWPDEGGNQRQSEVIRGHQRSSEVIRGHHFGIVGEEHAGVGGRDGDDRAMRSAAGERIEKGRA